jgi:hypothetical protein
MAEARSRHHEEEKSEEYEGGQCESSFMQHMLRR